MTIALDPELVEGALALYHDLHAHPELSMQEHRTVGLVESHLADLGYQTRRVGGTGVAAWLSHGDGPTVAFRADMDALPVPEATGLPYASTADGVMHACGHDIHVSCALGIARYLADHRAEWTGTVVLVLQPGEETSAGAQAMVDDGLWDVAPRPEAVFGQHVSIARVGTVDVTPGPVLAMADSWRVTVRGRGGHGSRPEKAIDPVLLAAHMIVRMQTVVTREVSATEVSVLTVATIQAGTKENVIPDRCEFTINMRHHDAEVRERVLVALRRTLRAEAEASGAPEPDIEEMYRFPLTVNDPAQAAAVREVLAAEFGADAVSSGPTRMGSEDVSRLATAIGVPLTFWYLGSLPDEVVDGSGPIPSLHTGSYAPVPEQTLASGIRAGLAVLLDRLG